MSETIKRMVSEGESQHELHRPPDCWVLIERLEGLHKLGERDPTGHVGYREDGDGGGDDQTCNTVANGQHPHWLRTAGKERKQHSNVK